MDSEKIGNMRKLHFCVCPVCGNLLFSVGEAAPYCCGKQKTARNAALHCGR